MLCRADKSPFWRGWQHHRAPLDEIDHHQARGLPVGVIPWSLRASGLDVDWGNPSDFATAYPPMARLPSRRPGGQHLWYRDTQPRRNLQQLAFPGWSGDLRSRTGYLINWAGEAGWEALLDGVYSFPPTPWEPRLRRSWSKRKGFRRRLPYPGSGRRLVYQTYGSSCRVNGTLPCSTT